VDVQIVTLEMLKNAPKIANIHAPRLVPETGGYGEPQSKKE
jgi:hypothetical protein